jgi:uncharacterized membrane protein HdeD (DUF308 family)
MPPTDVVRADTMDDADEIADSLWWVPLVTGSLWVLFALIVFRFDYSSVSALSILLGTVCLAAALFEAVAAAGARGWWRVARIGLAIVFAIVGVVAYVHPGNTFDALASVFAFYLLVRGIFEVVVAIVIRGAELWWVGLVTGTVQILLAFWAAGDFGHKAFLLVVWVGASALAHGIAEYVTAFRIRSRRPSEVRPA